MPLPERELRCDAAEVALSSARTHHRISLRVLREYDWSQLPSQRGKLTHIRLPGRQLAEIGPMQPLISGQLAAAKASIRLDDM